MRNPYLTTSTCPDSREKVDSHLTRNPTISEVTWCCGLLTVGGSPGQQCCLSFVTGTPGRVASHHTQHTTHTTTTPLLFSISSFPPFIVIYKRTEPEQNRFQNTNMKLAFTSALLLALSATSLAHQVQRCAMPAANPEEHAAWQKELNEAVRMGMLSTEKTVQAEVVIPIVWTVIHDGKTGMLTKEIIQQNIEHLNHFITPATNFRFVLKQVKYANSAKMFRISVPNFIPFLSASWDQVMVKINAIRKKFRVGDEKILNVMTADMSSIGLLGISGFPWDAKKVPHEDAVLITHQSIGGLDSYDTTYTAFNLG